MIGIEAMLSRRQYRIRKDVTKSENVRKTPETTPQTNHGNARRKVYLAKLEETVEIYGGTAVQLEITKIQARAAAVTPKHIYSGDVLVLIQIEVLLKVNESPRVLRIRIEAELSALVGYESPDVNAEARPWFVGVHGRRQENHDDRNRGCA